MKKINNSPKFKQYSSKFQLRRHFCVCLAMYQVIGHYRVGKDDLLVDEQGDNFISVEDYAMAMIDELLDPKHHQERFTIAY